MTIEKEVVQFITPDGTLTGETGPKWASHTADTKMHLGFSCYVFNDEGQVLVTQRARVKRVWPTVWTNTLCGHPAPGEDTVDAIKRRLQYELGMQATDFEVVLPTYTYKTPPYNGIVEHEFCPVYVAQATTEPKLNPLEVDACKWVSWEEFVTTTEADTDDSWSYWCKDQLQLLQDQPLIKEYTQP